MTKKYSPRRRYVIAPDGSPLSVADLPPTNTRRWVIATKAEVVAAVRGGLLSLEDACSRYELTIDEFLELASADRAAWYAGVKGDEGSGLQRRTALSVAYGAHGLAFQKLGL